MENMETAKKIIEVTVRDRVATHIGDDFYVCGNTEYEIHFDFDEEWDALDVKTARFIADGNVLYPDRIFSGNVCSFPDNPPISNTTNVRVGVFAGNLHTTTPARIPAVKSILCGTSTPAAPDEDAYHEAMKEMAKVATEARTQAEASAQSAQASAQSAGESAQSAAASAQSAEASAQSAVEADASAKDSAKSAATAGQHSNDAGVKAQAAAKSAGEAATSAEEAENAKKGAAGQADDAETSAKDAQTWAGRSENFAGNSAASAQEAASHATAAAASAAASSQSAAAAAESVKGIYIVTVAEKNGVQMASADAITIWQMAALGKVCLLVVPARERAYLYTGYSDGAKFDAVAQFPVQNAIPGLWLSSATVADDGTTTFADELPAKTPNPHKLTLTGGAEAEYDGSEAVSVNIPAIPAVFIIKAANSVNGVNQPADKTQAEIKAARDAGKVCLLLNTNSHRVYTYYGLENDAYVFKDTVYNPSAVSGKSRSLVAEVRSDNTVYFYENPLTAPNPKYLRLRGAVEANYYGGEEVNVDLPTKYPNPNKLTFTGAVKATYDGSGEVSVEIPAGGGGGENTAATEIREEFALGVSAESISDAAEWIQHTISGWKLRQRGCTYGNGLYIIVGTSGAMAISEDGKTWTAQAAITSDVLTAVAYGKGCFVCIDSAGNVYRATNPAGEWENVYTAEGIILESLVYANGGFVIVGDGGIILTSTDGESWSRVKDTGTTNDFYALTYGSGQYVAVGANGQISTSINGKDWTDRTDAAQTAQLRAVAYGNGVFVAGGAGGVIRYSADGKTWQTATHDSTSSVNYIRGIAYAEGRFYAVMYISTGKGEIWSSADGATWTIVKTTTGRLWCICTGADRFVASGDNGEIYSIDLGIEWMAKEPAPASGQHLWHRVVITLSDGGEIIGESIYRHQTSGGGAGLPETADPLKQLVTDAGGKVAWEDRLAYKYTAEVENLAATALVFAGDDGFVLGVPWAADVAAGSVCTVNYNGVDYDCTAIDYSAIMPPEAEVPKGVCALGNLDVLSIPGIAGGNADAPFVLMAFSSAHAADMGAYAMLMPMDGATSVTLAVRSVGEIIKKIDEKYLPEVTGGIVTAHAKITTLTADKIGLEGCNMTFAALWDAYSTGKMVQIMCSNETRMLCGRVNVGMINDGVKALQVDVPRDIALVGHFVVAAVDDGTGNVGFDMIGKVF